MSPTPESIKRVVAKRYDLTPSDLTGPKRVRGVALPRHIAMYLCRVATSLSFPKIGRAFGGRDHATVFYAVRKVTRRVAEEPSFAARVTELLDSAKMEVVGA